MAGYTIVNLLEIDDSVAGSGRVRLGGELREIREWDVIAGES